MEHRVFNIKRHHFLLVFNSHLLSTMPRATHLARLPQPAAKRKVKDQGAMVADAKLDYMGGSHQHPTGWVGKISRPGSSPALAQQHENPWQRGFCMAAEHVFQKKVLPIFFLYTCKQHTSRKPGPQAVISHHSLGGIHTDLHQHRAGISELEILHHHVATVTVKNAILHYKDHLYPKSKHPVLFSASETNCFLL